MGTINGRWVGLLSTVLAVGSLGCASSSAPKSGAASAGPTNAPNLPAAFVMQSGGRDVLRLAVAPGDTCTAKDGELHLESARHDLVELWLVPGAKTVDEALSRVPTQIQSEFKDFKATGTTDLVVAGAPAKRLTGSGVEADDGDPGTADVIVFQAGGRVFVACAHGESLSPNTQAWMMTVVQTARVP